MKKFINNILLIAGILITLILAITMLPMEQDGYLQAYNKKCQLLEDTYLFIMTASLKYPNLQVHLYTTVVLSS